MSRIFDVSTADVAILKSNPPSLLIAAAGRVNSSGWKNASLAPWFYVRPPEDGIQDFDFIAEEPNGITLAVMTPVSVSEVIAIDPANYWGNGRPLRGVRIHAQTNALDAHIDENTSAHNLLAVGGDDAWPWLLPFNQTKKSDILGLPVSDLLARSLRVYTEGDSLTFDYKPDRLNIELAKGTGLTQRFWLG